MFPRSPTRFAARFFYYAKPNKEDRGEGSDHPNVKPTPESRRPIGMPRFHPFGTPPWNLIHPVRWGLPLEEEERVTETYTFTSEERMEGFLSLASPRRQAGSLTS